MKRLRIEPDHLSVYCRDCGSWIEQTVTEDHGIGPYEFWGAKGVQHDYRELCPACGSDRVEEMANRPCDVCQLYDPDEYVFNGCKYDLTPGPDKLDRGDVCKFFEPQD